MSPKKASGKINLSIHPPPRVAAPSGSALGIPGKSVAFATDLSEDRLRSDLSSSSYDVASPLHFHGLAVTQTQTQVTSSAEESGMGNTRSGSRVAKRRKVAHDSHSPSSPEVSLRDLNKPSRSASKLKRRRSPSLASADSFAGAEEWEDPAKVFLAANRQFEVPLSELGRGPAREVPQEGYPPMVGTPSLAMTREPTQADLPPPPSSDELPASGPGTSPKGQRPGGQNDDALSQVSDVSVGASRWGRSPESRISEIPDDASTPPVMSNPGSMDLLDTQAEGYQATQPLTSEDLETNTNTTQVSDIMDPHTGGASPPEWSSVTSRPSTNTRNILGMVNPMKKWRHQQGQQLQYRAALHSASDGQTQPSANFSASSHALSAGRRLFEQLAAQMGEGPHSIPQDNVEKDDNPSLPLVDEDSRETAVVPDSEFSEPVDTSTPVQPILSTTRPNDSFHDSSVVPPASRSGSSPSRKGSTAICEGERSTEAKAGPPRVAGRVERATGKKVSRKRGIDTIPEQEPEHHFSVVSSRTSTPSLGGKARKGHEDTKDDGLWTRVFALWKQEAAYFSGTVYERIGGSERFKVQFDDGDEDVVEMKNLRRFELQVGDRVSVIERIKIQSRAIGSQWGNRTITAPEQVMTMIKSETSSSSSLLKNSSSTTSSKVLTKVGIVVTLSVNCDREKEKESIVKIIKSNGGTVLDDWSHIFSLAGEYSTNKKRWAIASDNISTDLKHDIHQVFLVSDAANTKPRYLTALALGIPCISLEWLKRLSSGQCLASDWPSYLLPAGYSDSLGARVTQMVDLDWGTTLDHLTGIMSNNVATKLFSNKSILVLGQDYFPPPAKGKKGTSGVGDEKSNDGGRFIPRIIVSMGAARVEAVPELKYASNPDLDDFQYVVVKDLYERPQLGREKYVSMEWVKDCLIAGRMFPPRV
ncbi:hypothetical protein B0F90DRAFT_1665773 [Multifurca ochricompacta]|uniref:BRCT domain-containing protein n=1 Tax=Multifurca ochricompacta TaxID=376703 RepID=A0AAD4M9U8_9AGAM|nr:hypothetical protein B0F90DRAFT_1665773 [Multifurca ochricompacta]